MDDDQHLLIFSTMSDDEVKQRSCSLREKLAYRLKQASLLRTEISALDALEKARRAEK